MIKQISLYNKKFIKENNYEKTVIKEFLFEKEKLLVNIKNTLFSSKVLENFDYFKDVYIINSLKDYASVINLLILDYYWVKENKNSKKNSGKRKVYFQRIIKFWTIKANDYDKKSLLGKEFVYIKKSRKMHVWN